MICKRSISTKGRNEGEERAEVGVYLANHEHGKHLAGTTLLSSMGIPLCAIVFKRSSDILGVRVSDLVKRICEDHRVLHSVHCALTDVRENLHISSESEQRMASIG